MTGNIIFYSIKIWRKIYIIQFKKIVTLKLFETFKRLARTAIITINNDWIKSMECARVSEIMVGFLQ